MQKFASVNDVLDFAISEEEGAVKIYMDLAAKVKRPEMKKVFEGFAEEEEGHKRKLISIKNGKRPLLTNAAVTNLKIAEYVVDVDTENLSLDYQQALIVAMKKEKFAFRLYSDLADNTEESEYQALFLALAQEEAKHKLRFEIEYDDQFLTEN
ncbi:MAG: ferritin family protein [bacterium]|nr:ferritin family protein [bacterium]